MISSIVGVLFVIVVAIIAFKVLKFVASVMIRLFLFLALVGAALYIGWRYIL